jgi:hypothetical protein
VKKELRVGKKIEPVSIADNNGAILLNDITPKNNKIKLTLDTNKNSLEINELKNFYIAITFNSKGV